MVKKQTKPSSVISILLIFLSFILGICTAFLTSHFPNLADKDFYIRLTGLIIIIPLVIVFYSRFYYTLPDNFAGIKHKVLKLGFLTAIFAIATGVFAFHFIANRPDLFDWETLSFTIYFPLVFPFLFFSLGFVILSTTLLKYAAIFKYGVKVVMTLMIWARSILLIAAVFLLVALITSFHAFWVNY